MRKFVIETSENSRVEVDIDQRLATSLVNDGVLVECDEDHFHISEDAHADWSDITNLLLALNMHIQKLVPDPKAQTMGISAAQVGGFAIFNGEGDLIAACSTKEEIQAHVAGFFTTELKVTPASAFNGAPPASFDPHDII